MRRGIAIAMMKIFIACSLVFCPFNTFCQHHFFNEKGMYLGHNGGTENKVYLIKTIKKKFHSRGDVPAVYIEDSTARYVEEFIKDRFKKKVPFSSDPFIYKNVIEIEGRDDVRDAIITIVEQDNGAGGNIDSNNKREYGGTVDKNGFVKEVKKGPVSKNCSGTATIEIPSDANTEYDFHSHPSGICPFTIHAMLFPPIKLNRQFMQAPSDVDTSGARGRRIAYVFGRSDSTVYIYNDTGILATMPHLAFKDIKKFTRLKRAGRNNKNVRSKE
jgi:hypothetical protein